MSGLGLKRALFGAAIVGLLGYMVLTLLRAPNTPEERVRYAILDAIDEFNDRDLDVLRLFAKGYRDGREVKSWDAEFHVAYVVHNQKDGHRPRLPFHVALID